MKKIKLSDYVNGCRVDMGLHMSNCTDILLIHIHTHILYAYLTEKNFASNLTIFHQMREVKWHLCWWDENNFWQMMMKIASLIDPNKLGSSKIVTAFLIFLAHFYKLVCKREFNSPLLRLDRVEISAIR